MLAWHFGLFAGPPWRLTVVAVVWPTFDIRWGGVDMLLPKWCKRSAVLFGRGDQLPYLPASPLRRVMMPPTRMSRKSGVGPSVFGISTVDVPRGVGWGGPLLVGSPPDKRAFRPYIGVIGWGYRGAEGGHILGPNGISRLLFEVGAEAGHIRSK